MLWEIAEAIPAKIIRRCPAVSRRETAGVPCSAPATASEVEEHLQEYVPQHALHAVARAGEVRPRPLTGATPFGWESR